MNAKSISDPRTVQSSFNRHNAISNSGHSKRAPWLAIRLGPGEITRTQPDSKGDYRINGYPVRESETPGTWAQRCEGR
jgi:hypothetical protein